MGRHAVILLAAGSSARFGSPKQLAKNDGQSFIQHAVAEATKLESKVFVVLGANYDIVKNEIENFPVEVIYNKDWEEGMSSSIRIGIESFLNKDPAAEAVIIIVCDQPFLSSQIIMELIKKFEQTGKPIIACSYKNAIGTPVLFDKSFFPALLALKGKAGAKNIILKNKDVIETIPFPLGYIDIDTREDYEILKKVNKN